MASLVFLEHQVIRKCDLARSEAFFPKSVSILRNSTTFQYFQQAIVEFLERFEVSNRLLRSNREVAARGKRFYLIGVELGAALIYKKENLLLNSGFG